MVAGAGPTLLKDEKRREALRVLDRLLPLAEAGGRMDSVIEILSLKIVLTPAQDLV